MKSEKNIMQTTKAQNDFINSEAKFIRLLAPAGCGKTHCIVEKTKKILECNPKAKIRIFTFTKNAAEEIKGRCPVAPGLDTLTLNSWGNAYIRRKLKNPRKIDEKEKKFFLCNNLKGIWCKTAYKNVYEPVLSGKQRIRNGQNLLDRISDFKNIGFKHTDFSKDFGANWREYEKHIQFIKDVDLNRYYATIRESIISLLVHKKKLNMTEKEQDEFVVRHWIPFWKDCCEEMIKTDRFLFDDQKYIANLYLEEQKEKHENWTGTTKLDYIFIDEFQDISPLDLMLISNLQQLNDASLIIVGDDDQAIFEFRGASPYFILHPNEVFNNQFDTFALDENFRSPKNIVEKSMLLIKNNLNRFNKQVRANPEKKDADIKLYEYEKSSDMVDAIIADIKNTPKDNNVVVLSRKKSSLLPYQILLTKDKIKYAVREDLSFFYTGPAEKLQKAMQIKQDKSFERWSDLTELICMFPKNEIFSTAKKIICHELMYNYCPIEEIDKQLIKMADKHQELKFFTYEIAQNVRSALQKFIKAKDVYETLSVLLTYFGAFQQNYFRSLDDLYYKDPPLSSLLSFASKYDDDFRGFVSDFEYAIEYAKAQSDDDAVIVPDNMNVFLSTALRVKGQEFDKVIILDAIDGIWPHRKKEIKTNPDDKDDIIVLDDVKLSDCVEYNFVDGELIPTENICSDTYDIESERRLFYVAATRAKQELHLYRTVNITEKEQSKISPFVIEGKYNE